MRRARGFTLIEMIITVAILSLLAGLAIPVARNDSKRRREVALKYSLSELRRAIDGYKADCERGLVGPLDRKLNDECYPPKLDVLVEGIHPPNSTRTIRYLRAIPIDPMSGKAEWGLRSVQDEPDTASWGEQNIYDVYTLSDGTALNGTRYRGW